MPKNPFKWLYPGMKVKRWLFTALLGVVVVSFGAVLTAEPYVFISTLGIVWILCGMVLIVLGMGKMIVSLLTLFLPKGERDLVNILYQRRYLERGPKIVTIGGGHGLSHLIFGLKEYSSNITAIVTVADSGGSSGRLREEFNIVAPGDIRNCLVALVDYFGTMTPFKQLASISIPDPRTVIIQPWDPTVIPGIEKAILASNLGVTPSNDGKVVRLSIPPLSEERRGDLAKVVKDMAEKSRVSLRTVRRDANDKLKKMQHDKTVSEDDYFKSHDDVQKLTDKYIKEIDDLLEKKSKSLMEVA